jgi:hypothetical protein
MALPKASMPGDGMPSGMATNMASTPHAPTNSIHVQNHSVPVKPGRGGHDKSKMGG